MSTRATYRFVPDNLRFDDNAKEWWDSNEKPAVTLYIHHDGYPEGAAQYLDGVHSPEGFIRKNDRAGITANHEVHGDTEYRYDISVTWTGPDIHRQVGIKAFKREGWGYETTWKEFFDGSLESFVETYQNTPIAKAINSN